MYPKLLIRLASRIARSLDTPQLSMNNIIMLQELEIKRIRVMAFLDA